MHCCEHASNMLLFWYVGADLHFLALSQAPGHTSRPRIGASVSHDVPVYSPAFAGYSFDLLMEGWPRLSRPWCLVLH